MEREIELRLVDDLRVHDASPERVERIRARCLVSLDARRRAGQVRLPVWRGWLEPALALGLSAFYLAAAIGTTLQLAEVIRSARTLLR